MSKDKAYVLKVDKVISSSFFSWVEIFSVINGIWSGF